jgi:hypothetical protein
MTAQFFSLTLRRTRALVRYVLRQECNAQYAHQVTLIAVCVSIDPLV